MERHTYPLKRQARWSVTPHLPTALHQCPCPYGKNTNSRFRHFYGKCLATTKLTVVSLAEAQDITKAVEQRKDHSLCCPEILNVHVISFLACNSKGCKKRVNCTPGSKIVKCNNCSRSMLIKNCCVDNQEKENKLNAVTAFPKVLSAFLEKGCHFL